MTLRLERRGFEENLVPLRAMKEVLLHKRSVHALRFLSTSKKLSGT